ncbi:patatin-like phospholipase family protein [Paenibacillus xerothermodurans]|uniref:patatin-like phospholipase family protein n=1 Tax=Paenibacillus xerothermodurans TaxID=1977292 RepID=UPI001FB3EF98|nr:patatin-like phospholipase family protein [Paenibacillus xerothermodurans]
MQESKRYKEMSFVGTNVSTHFSVIFASSNTPKMIDAVRISMSLPLFFQAVKWENDYYVDGGVLMNYPVRMFDMKEYVENEDNFTIPEHYRVRNGINVERAGDILVQNKETLGFRLDSKEEQDVLIGTVPPEHSN